MCENCRYQLSKGCTSRQPQRLTPLRCPWIPRSASISRWYLIQILLQELILAPCETVWSPRTARILLPWLDESLRCAIGMRCHDSSLVSLSSTTHPMRISIRLVLLGNNLKSIHIYRASLGCLEGQQRIIVKFSTATSLLCGCIAGTQNAYKLY